MLYVFTIIYLVNAYCQHYHSFIWCIVTIYTIILFKSVGVIKRQVAILARSSREMYQTVRID